MDLTFVILTWNSERFLKKCFDTIISKCLSEEVAYEIRVVDNGSTDRSADIFKFYEAMQPDSFVVRYLDKNHGTTYPRNLALKEARGEIICILDSDTELLHGSLREVFTTLKEREELGVLAPQLIYPEGNVQNSVKKFPVFTVKLKKLLKIFFKISIKDNDFYPDFPFPSPRKVDTAISACWFFRKSLLDVVGLLDENIFYAPEDVEFCCRVNKAGKEVLYWPHVTVLHNTQQISHRKPFSKVSLSHFGGLIYYFRKHGGWLFPPRYTSE